MCGVALPIFFRFEARIMRPLKRDGISQIGRENPIIREVAHEECLAHKRNSSQKSNTPKSAEDGQATL